MWLVNNSCLHTMQLWVGFRFCSFVPYSLFTEYIHGCSHVDHRDPIQQQYWLWNAGLVIRDVIYDSRLWCGWPRYLFRKDSLILSSVCCSQSVNLRVYLVEISCSHCSFLTLVSQWVGSHWWRHCDEHSCVKVPSSLLNFFYRLPFSFDFHECAYVVTSSSNDDLQIRSNSNKFEHHRSTMIQLWRQRAYAYLLVQCFVI